MKHPKQEPPARRFEVRITRTDCFSLRVIAEDTEIARGIARRAVADGRYVEDDKTTRDIDVTGIEEIP